MACGELEAQREEMSKLNIRPVAAQAAREAVGVEMSRTACSWQHWARVFGYPAPTLSLTAEHRAWVLAEEQRGAPVTAFSVIPKERLMQDLVSMTVCTTHQFHAG